MPRQAATVHGIITLESYSKNYQSFSSLLQEAAMNEIVQFIRDNNWAAIIKERQESGLTIIQWCAENNVSEGAYYIQA